MTTAQINMHIENHIGWLEFDNRARRNAMTLTMWLALAEKAKILNANPDVRAIVLRGAGEEAFVSGADISEFEAQRANAAGALAYEAATTAALKNLGDVEKPVIAMIHGFCFGGGLAIAMKADFRLAADGAQFCIPAAKLGIAYPPDSIRDLAGLTGAAAAKDILYTGRRLPASEAVQMGLITRRVSPQDLRAEVDRFCAMLIANAPLSIRAAKETIKEIISQQHNPAHIKQCIEACFNSEDYAEGRRAFLQKRTPEFKGR